MILQKNVHFQEPTSISDVISSFTDNLILLHKAKNQKEVIELIKTFPYDINSQFNELWGDTILNNLLSFNRIDAKLLEIMLKNGFNPNIPNLRYGRISSFYAKSYDLHKILIDNGLNINYTCLGKQNVLQNNFLQMGQTDLKLIELYLDNGINILNRDTHNQTLIMSIRIVKPPKYNQITDGIEHLIASKKLSS